MSSFWPSTHPFLGVFRSSMPTSKLPTVFWQQNHDLTWQWQQGVGSLHVDMAKKWVNWTEFDVRSGHGKMPLPFFCECKARLNWMQQSRTWSEGQLLGMGGNCRVVPHPLFGNLLKPKQFCGKNHSRINRTCLGKCSPGVFKMDGHDLADRYCIWICRGLGFFCHSYVDQRGGAESDMTCSILVTRGLCDLTSHVAS